MRYKGWSARPDFDAFGKRTVLEVDGSTVRAKSSYEQTRGFTGYNLADETGIYYARARMYLSGLERFVGRDTMEYVDGLSMYQAYFIPNSIDPYGHDEWGHVDDNRNNPQCNPCTGPHKGTKCHTREHLTVNPKPFIVPAFTYTNAAGKQRRCSRTDANMEHTRKHEDFHVQQINDLAKRVDSDLAYPIHCDDLDTCLKTVKAMVLYYNKQVEALPEPDMPDKSPAEEAADSEAAGNKCADFVPVTLPGVPPRTGKEE
jgi:RHS repeat-associated protein